MRLLLCTDGSSHHQAALRFGALLAQGSPEATTILGVLEHPEYRPMIEEALEEGKQLLRLASPPRVKTRTGRLEEQILEEADTEAYDLVVVGARERWAIARMLLGSTSERIAREAPLPVLIAHGGRESIQRMLICTTLGEPGLATVKLGGQVAQLSGAYVTVLHVMSQLAATHDLAPVLLEDLEAPAEVLISHETPEGTHLERAIQILSALGVPTAPRVRHGLVVDEILAEVSEGDYDLVVIGAHMMVEGLMRFLVEDIAHQLICRIDRPILVVRT